MAEAEQGTIIKDLGKSLPTLEDFFYNDLEGYDTAQLPDQKGAEKILFYQEAPPETAEFLGYSANGALLSLKVPKEAFNITVQGAISNSFSGNNIRVDLSKAEYGGFDNVKAQIELFKTNPALAGYLQTVGADNKDLYERNGMAFAANLRLLFCNMPDIPRFSSTEVEEQTIIKKTYSEIKDKLGTYIICKTPYPYDIKYSGDSSGAVSFYCENYANSYADINKKYADADEIYFISSGNTYRQVIPLGAAYENRYDTSSIRKRQILVLNQDKSTEALASSGYAAKDLLIKNIQEAKDIRLVLDVNAMDNQAKTTTYLMEYPLDYNNTSPTGNFTNYIRDLANKIFDDGWYQYAGYVPYGLDQYHRISGVIYIQKEVVNPKTKEKELVWYNLNKMLIAEANNRESPLPDETISPTDRYHINYGPAELKPYTYDYRNRTYVDAFWKEAGEFEEKRRATQRQIFKDTDLVDLFPAGSGDYATNDDVLYRWTVSLGDVTFFVPPESIRIVSQTDTIRIPVMRARGTIAKGRERSMQYLELNLFFNENRGINGVPYTVESPNKKQKFTYNMNGFRALLAQMKFTPFLPIVNQYINEDLGIFAVCIENLDVSTVPGFPKLLKARILLSKFNYQVYMPEIPLPDNDSKIQRADKNGQPYIEKRNPFSACIDYDTMRWYYQRCIMLGNELDRLLNLDDKAKRITVNSLEFYTRTIFANRTALLPCHFEDPMLSVYIADEDHLKNLLQIKQDAMKKNLNVSDNYNPTENESRLIKDADRLVSNVNIGGIYAKHVSLASVILAALDRADVTGQEEITDDGAGGRIKIHGDKVTYKGKTYQTSDASDVNEFLVACIYKPLETELKQAADSIKNEEDLPLVSKVELDLSHQLITMRLNTEPYLSEKERKNTTRESSVYLKKQNPPSHVDPDDIFKDCLISLKLPYYTTTRIASQDFLRIALNQLRECFQSSGSINRNADAYDSLAFLNWCHTTGKGVVDANDEASRLKQSIDYEDVHSLKYNLILENALVTQFSASVGNTYARIGVTGIDGSAPQYMGGQDTKVSFTIETKDEYIASTFKSLPELTAYYNRTYRKVLPTYPIKIDSDFTRMMGIIEITLDNVVVTTVEGFPGLYRIVVNATSVDRTLRNKEALRLLDVKNEGLEDSRKKTQVNIKRVKELDREFAKAEIYPDLELPKIGELGELGWRYIRYRKKERNESDFYIDPDFYFVYPSLTVGRAIIESLRCTFDDDLRKEVSEDDIKQLLTDTTGAVRSVRKNGGIDKEKMNDAAKQDEQDRMAQKINAVKQDRVYFMDRNKSVVFRIPFGSFDIGNKIRCVFTEPYYIKECNWIKEQDANKKAEPIEEKVLEIKITTVKKGSLDIANQIEAKKKEAGPEYRKIQFVDENNNVVKTIDNPNWSSKQEEKITDNFKKFEDCAAELEQYLVKTNNLATVSVDGNTDNPLDISVYDASTVQNFFKNSGFWTITRKYGIFDKQNVEEVVTEYNARDFVDGDNVNVDAINAETKIGDRLTYIIQAVADAISGETECTSKNKNKGFGKLEWQADLKKPRVINGDTVSTVKDLIGDRKSYSFGIFGIKKYTYQQLYRLLPPDEKDELEKAFATDKEQYFVLDPYFRYKDKDIRDKYLENCATSPTYCATAFMRLVVWYFAKLLRYHVIPSIEFDVKRQENINAADATKAAEEFLKKQGVAMQQSTSTLYAELRSFAANNGDAFDAGKFFAATLLALTEEGFGKNTLFDMYDKRDYNGLNGLIQSVVSIKYKIRNENDPTYFSRNQLIRRYILALYGYGLIKDPNNINKDVTASPAQKFLTNYNTKIALEACSNPVRYMRDSFFDAIRQDYRGRMLRAFPTFYMVFVDEGREVGLWKLHDNFYNFNAIHEIQIVKSRKIAADTCKITLSNMFQTFTTNDEDCTINYKGNLGDLWESFFDPQSSMKEEELRRLAAKKINRAKLQPGVRIHVRMGYGANAADLPCAFNGVIADIKPGELVEVVAQGDGVELCNPIYMEDDADIVKNNDNFATMDKCVCGLPAKEILQGFLTAKGGPMAAWIRNQYRNNFFGTGFSNESAAAKLAEENNAGDQFWSQHFDEDGWKMYGLLNIFNNNPYGIRHFGDPSYRDIFAQGEPAQNLYEVTNKAQSVFASDIENKAYFGDGALDLDDKIDEIWNPFDTNDELPYISFKPYGKTVWDIMHICKSIAPDYVTGIADFQFRSTVFLGKPHYYYAYKYIYDGGGVLYEKRKPYQQWHLYNNFSDIVDNKISASSEKMKTNAAGVYEVEGGSGMKKTATMWVDQDIYPEFQKSMIVDTKLYGKSWWKHNGITGTIGATLGRIPLIGSLGNFLFGDSIAYLTNDLLDEHFATWFDNRGSVMSHANMAEEAVIDALKTSVKEMYQGYLIVLGDPSVKPNDRIQITDAYEDMSGLCDVREVVHSLSAQTGFTTTITPDAISCHDLKNEIMKHNVWMQIIARTTGATALALGGYWGGTKLWKRGDKVVKAATEAAKEKTQTLTEAIKVTMSEKDRADVLAKIKAKDAKGAVEWFTKQGQIGWKKLKFFLDDFGLGVVKVKGSTVSGAKNLLSNSKNLKGLLTLTPQGLAGAVITNILCGAVNTALYRTIKGMQTLYIFPLRKFGKPLTAGLDGQQGLIYGTAQFNTPGPIEQLVAKCFAHSKDPGLWGGFSDFLRGLVIDDQVMDLADRFDTSADGELREAAMSGSQEALDEVDLQSIGGPQLDKSLYRSQSAYILSLMPRTMVDGIQRNWAPSTDKYKETIWQAVKNRYYIDNPKTWVVNPNLRNLVYLEDNIKLKRYFESGFLRTLPQVIQKDGEGLGLNKDNLMTFPVHMPQGSSKQVTGVKRTEKQKTGDAVVLDLPYSSQEGLQIIAELCEYIQINTAYLTRPDDQENKQANKDTTIIISSSLVAGSAHPLYGSGFHLILTGTGKLGESGVLKKCVQEYRDILQKKLEDPNSKYDHLPLFTIDENIKKDNEVGINIGVPSPFKNNIVAKKLESPNTFADPKDTDKEQEADKVVLNSMDFTQHVFYSKLDEQQRPHMAYARITYEDIAAAQNKVRSSLGSVNPPGFNNQITYERYGEQLYLYNRCHIIAHSLEGEEDNPRNLFTGTQDMNQRMYIYEKQVSDYLKKNRNSTVLYRVTPMYSGTNLLPSYVIMEATDMTGTKQSEYKPISLFNQIIYNTQLGWTIDYATGKATQKQ